MNSLPLFSSVCAGSPFPIDETENFDLADHLIQHPADTVFVRVTGNSMNGSGIFDGDVLIVDKRVEPRQSDVVVAQTDAGYTVKTFGQQDGRLRLVPTNPDFQPIEINEDARICGVATFCLHRL